MTMTPKIVMATDGACSGNPGPGGWGTVLTLVEPDGTVAHTKALHGGDPNTTNNRMELTAVIEGFRALKHPSTVEVQADSQYIVKAFADGWLAKWQANGWRTSKKEAVENRELWETLLALTAPHTITWTWVKGHAGHPLNSIASAFPRLGACARRGSSEQTHSPRLVDRTAGDSMTSETRD